VQKKMSHHSAAIYNLNSKIVLGLGLVLMVVLNLLFYYDYRDEVKNGVSQVNKQLNIQKELLDEGMSLMFNSVYLQRSWLEDRLNSLSDYNNEDFDISIFSYDSSLNISSMDVSPPENEYSYGNVFFHGDIQEAEHETSEEIGIIKDVFDLQRFLKENTSFDTWSTYYTKDYIMIYPFGSSRENVKDAGELFSAIRQSIDQLSNETNQEVFEKGWDTDIFFDHTGQLLMFSKNLPVIKGDRVYGIIAVNISVADIGNYVQNSNEMEVYLTDSGGNLVYKDGSSIEEMLQLRDFFQQKYNLSDIEGILVGDKPRKIKDKYYFTAQMQNVNWKLTYVIPEKLIETSVVNRYIIYAVTNIFIILSIGFIYRLILRYGRKAGEIDRMKDEFVMTVSHELKSPLSSIIGFSEMIKNKLEGVVFPAIKHPDNAVEKAVERIRRNSAIIEKEGERLNQLIDNLLDINLLEYGEMVFNQQPHDVRQIMEEGIQALQPLIRAKGLKVSLETDENMPMVLVDRGKIIQVIINLLSNSVKFTEEGYIRCSARKSNDVILFSVEDTGVGIPEAYQDGLFEKFTQVQRDRKGQKGIGLGLAICKNIIYRHGGRIWVKSEEGKGTCFFFTLPASE